MSLLLTELCIVRGFRGRVQDEDPLGQILLVLFGNDTCPTDNGCLMSVHSIFNVLLSSDLLYCLLVRFFRRKQNVYLPTLVVTVIIQVGLFSYSKNPVVRKSQRDVLIPTSNSLLHRFSEQRVFECHRQPSTVSTLHLLSSSSGLGPSGPTRRGYHGRRREGPFPHPFFQRTSRFRRTLLIGGGSLVYSNLFLELETFNQY